MKLYGFYPKRTISPLSCMIGLDECVELKETKELHWRKSLFVADNPQTSLGAVSGPPGLSWYFN